MMARKSSKSNKGKSAASATAAPNPAPDAPLNNDDGNTKSLTKRNLARFATAERRRDARRRGQSTPPPSPKLRDDDSTYSSSTHIKKTKWTPALLAELDRNAHEMQGMFAQFDAPGGTGAGKPAQALTRVAETTKHALPPDPAPLHSKLPGRFVDYIHTDHYKDTGLPGVSGGAESHTDCLRDEEQDAFGTLLPAVKARRQHTVV
jgi:hypothetical protein